MCNVRTKKLSLNNKVKLLKKAIMYLTVKFALDQDTEGREGEQMYSSTPSITLALGGVGGKLHAPTLNPRERRDTHCIGGWVAPSAGLDGCRKSRPHQDLILGPYGP